tara:strand:+ start:1841 stop:1966 length:126 start_codon:yes stop_codon:yes gene_type:complete
MKIAVIIISFFLIACANKTIKLSPIEIYGNNEQSIPEPIYE